VNNTVLLITSPRLLNHGGRSSISLSSKSQLLLDPFIPQANILRKRIARLNPPCNAPSTNTIFQHPKVRQQMTFCQLLETVCTAPEKKQIAYISAILTKCNLYDLFQRQQLFCMPCSSCMSPLYGNIIHAKCVQCPNSDTTLRFNPQILGGLGDEAGGFSCTRTSPHNFKISNRAFQSLLGRSAEQFAALAGREGTALMFKQLEQRIIWLRLTYVFMYRPEAEDVWLVDVLG